MDEMIGRQFGKLVVLERDEDHITPSGGVHRKYICKCECGKTVSVMKEHLTSGRQKSCGCLKRLNGKPTHRQIKTRLYKIWGNMVNRCTNDSNPAWINYGGRGITVCEQWRKFEQFRDWALSHGYNDTLQIDRINNDLGYCPDNCRWVDGYVQANNKRNNHLIEYMGVSKPIGAWAREYNIPYKTLHRRINSLHWSIDRALNTPVKQK